MHLLSSLAGVFPPEYGFGFPSLISRNLIRELNTDHHASLTHRAVADAREYNHYCGVIVEADQHKATGTVQSEGPYDYYSLLQRDRYRYHGRLRTKSIGVDSADIPRTSDSTLAKGVGHCMWNGPSGWRNPRSVLSFTAHRGYIRSDFVNDLIIARTTRRVEVFGEVSTYKVIETRVIEPDDTQAISLNKVRISCLLSPAHR